MDTTQNQTVTEQPLPTKRYVTYDEFEIERLMCNPVATKAIPFTKHEQELINKGEKVTPTAYHEIPLSYNHGTPEVKKAKTFYLEGAEVKCSGGIVAQPAKNDPTKMLYSIFIVYDTSDPEQIKMLAVKDRIYQGCAYAVQQVRATVGVPQFSAAHAEMCMFKPQTYIQKDPMTNEPLKDKTPSCFMKLFKFDTGKTLFTDPNGTPIDWELLKKVDMKIIPTEHYRKVHIGAGRPSLTISLASAIVTEIKVRESGNMQAYTLTKLKTARPDLADSVASQLAKITASRQDLLSRSQTDETQTEGGTGEEHTEGGATFANIAPTPTNTIPVPPLVESVALPTITPVSTMADFTAGAPMRIPAIPGMNLPGGVSLQLN